MDHKIRRETKSSRQRHKMVQKAESSSCFNCWHKQQKCTKGTLKGSCTRCNNIGPRQAVENAPSLEDSQVSPCLEELISSTPSIPDGINFSCLIAITTTQPTETKNLTRIDVSKPFYPWSSILADQIDTMVRNTLGLKIRGTDRSSDLVAQACLAGSYLSIMFQHRNNNSSSFLPDMPSLEMESTETALKKHIVKFSIIRFGELSQELIRALRALDSSDIDSAHSINVIAAAGILYSELDHVKQRFLDGKFELLCIESSLLDLQNTLKSWLGQLGKEILLRLQKNCGAIRSWADGLYYPWNDARRTVDVRSITLTIDSIPQQAQETISSANNCFQIQPTSEYPTSIILDDKSTQSGYIPGLSPAESMPDELPMPNFGPMEPFSHVTMPADPNLWAFRNAKYVSRFPETRSSSVSKDDYSATWPTSGLPHADARRLVAQDLGDLFHMEQLLPTSEGSWRQNHIDMTFPSQQLNCPAQQVPTPHCICCPSHMLNTLRGLNPEPLFTYGPTILP